MITKKLKFRILDMLILTIALYGETPWPLVVEPVMAAVAILNQLTTPGKRWKNRRNVANFA